MKTNACNGVKPVKSVSLKASQTKMESLIQLTTALLSKEKDSSKCDKARSNWKTSLDVPKSARTVYSDYNAQLATSQWLAYQVLLLIFQKMNHCVLTVKG